MEIFITFELLMKVTYVEYQIVHQYLYYYLYIIIYLYIIYILNNITIYSYFPDSNLGSADVSLLKSSSIFYWNLIVANNRVKML